MPQTRSQYLHISSANRDSGTISDFRVSFHNSLVQGAVGESIQCIVTEVVMNRSWYTVSPSNNSFTLRTNGVPSTVSLPIGYYSTQLLRAQLATVLPGWTVSYSLLTNQFAFVPPAAPPSTTYGLTFNTPCAGLLGFNVADAPTCSTNAAGFSAGFGSTIPAKLNVESAVLVHCDVPKLRCSVVDNVAQPYFIESDVLISVPISVAPFDTISYVDAGGATFAVDLALNYVHDVRIWLTDNAGNALALPYDWNMVLKLIYSTPDEVGLSRDVRRIADDVRLAILSDAKISGVVPH